VVHVSVSGGPSDTAPALLDRLVGGHNRLALTVDDGVSTEVVSAYVDFVAASAIRLTFFVNGVNSSWTAVRAKLAPLVESGQVQLANHTWNHPSITRLSRSEIAEQLERNEKFLRNTYGVEGRPYFRPPYGRHNAWTDRVTAEHGFTETVLWWGSLGDAQPISGAQILALARTWFRPERIVIGHANHPGVMTAYPQLLELIRERSLQTVTLRDAFAGAQLAH
jgi:peptidoglycan/xylan/chitin deacetylase (PgdA/CDA1 family)